MLPAFLALAAGLAPPAAPAPADLIVHNGKVVTLDARSRIARAVAVRGGKVVAVGDDKVALALKGPKTRVIDGKGRMVLPGLWDSHTHPVGVVTTELADPPPVLRSLKETFAFIRKRAAAVPRERCGGQRAGRGASG